MGLPGSMPEIEVHVIVHTLKPFLSARGMSSSESSESESSRSFRLPFACAAPSAACLGGAAGAASCLLEAGAGASPDALSAGAAAAAGGVISGAVAAGFGDWGGFFLASACGPAE